MFKPIHNTTTYKTTRWKNKGYTLGRSKDDARSIFRLQINIRDNIIIIIQDLILQKEKPETPSLGNGSLITSKSLMADCGTILPKNSERLEMGRGQTGRCKSCDIFRDAELVDELRRNGVQINDSKIEAAFLRDDAVGENGVGGTSERDGGY